MTAELRTAQVFTTRSDAEIAKARLAAEGIDAMVMADDEGGLNRGFFATYGVRVVVREAQLAGARQALGVPSLHIPAEAMEAIAQHSRFCAPEEACGMFAVGDDGAVTMVYCLTNVDRSSRSFTIDPAEHYHAWAHARSCGWDIGGIFHSHPESLPQPSPDDLVGLDPEWVSVIVSPAGVRAYRVRDGVPSEVFVERSPR